MAVSSFSETLWALKSLRGVSLSAADEKGHQLGERRAHVKHGVGHLALAGRFGPGLADPSFGYSFVYHLEIGLLFATLVALGPLVRVGVLDQKKREPDGAPVRLAEFPT